MEQFDQVVLESNAIGRLLLSIVFLARVIILSSRSAPHNVLTWSMLSNWVGGSACHPGFALLTVRARLLKSEEMAVAVAVAVVAARVRVRASMILNFFKI
jgi:hypothetical protein